MVTIEGMTEAHFDCLKKKRNTANATKFELNYELYITQLVEEVNSRTYYPSTSIAFVVTRPRYREVFAADFRDRILHHYIALRLMPLLDNVMSDRSYSCRVGKGTLAGVNQLEKDIIEISKNYSEDCYIAKIDIKGFFMSIDRMKAAKSIDAFIVENYQGVDKEDLRWITWILINHAPENDCILKSPKKLWEHIIKSKSLFTNGVGMGMPIGNLLSQMVANFFVDIINRIAEKYGIKEVRYVDDMALVCKDKETIYKAIREIRVELHKLGLTLHPNKFYIQHYTKGVVFTGAVLKPHRRYVANRTVYSFEDSVRKLELAKSVEEIQKCALSVNSYLGTMKHFNTYAIRRRVLQNSEIYDKVIVEGYFATVKLKSKYNERDIIFREIKEGKFCEITELASPILIQSA